MYLPCIAKQEVVANSVGSGHCHAKVRHLPHSMVMHGPCYSRLDVTEAVIGIGHDLV